MMIREPTGCAKIKVLRRSLCGFMVIIAQCYFAVVNLSIPCPDAPEPSRLMMLMLIIGGGYCVPADIGHLKFTASIAEKAGAEMAVLLPTYDLAPQAPYPRQLKQAVGVLRYLITELGRKPESIILAGDSAGQFRRLLLLWKTNKRNLVFLGSLHLRLSILFFLLFPFKLPSQGIELEH